MYIPDKRCKEILKILRKALGQEVDFLPHEESREKIGFDFYHDADDQDAIKTLHDNHLVQYKVQGDFIVGLMLTRQQKFRTRYRFGCVLRFFLDNLIAILALALAVIDFILIHI